VGHVPPRGSVGPLGGVRFLYEGHIYYGRKINFFILVGTLHVCNVKLTLYCNLNFTNVN
jgi:hypothetical protein